MTDKEPMKRKPADQAKKRTNATSSKISGSQELTGDELDAASGGAGHCATGKHLTEATITVRK